jgi:hypothetical protein
MLMALELTTGSTKTIKLEPILPPDSTNVSIASADYGTPPKPQVTDDRMSVSFTVKDGLNALVIGLASRSASEETWELTLDGTQVVMVTVRQHSGPSVININGTTAP